MRGARTASPSSSRPLLICGRMYTTLSALLLCSTVAACGAGRSVAESGSSAQPGTTPAISEEDLRERVDRIAADSMQGRFTGSAGHVMATEYLAGELARMGAQPAGERGTYFQDVPFVRRHLVTHDLSVDGEPLELGRDFVPLHPGGRPREFDGARVVFGGVLEDTTRQIDRDAARGKFVILVYADSRNRAGNVRSARPGDRLGTAAAIATVNPDVAMDGWRSDLGHPAPVYAGDDDPDEPRVGGLAISADAAERLLGRPADTTVALGTPGALVHGELTFRAESLTVRNVIAVLPGRDAGGSTEYVAIGAHSDHVPYRRTPADFDSLRAFNALALEKQRELGRPYLRAAERAAITVNLDSLRAIRPARYDSIYNGADDDASGTAALLEIAEALVAGEDRPSRSILFVWHAAEELGLLGSRYFTDQPTVDRAAIVAQLNVDMIGRGGRDDLPGGGPTYLQLIGWRRLSADLGNVIDEVNQRQTMPFVWDLQYDAPGHPEQLYCRSDHYNYARHGIPVAFFSTGMHVDYHQVTDESQYLDYAKLARVTRLVRDVAVSLANLDRRPTVRGPVPDPDADCVQ